MSAAPISTSATTALPVNASAINFPAPAPSASPHDSYVTRPPLAHLYNARNPPPSNGGRITRPRTFSVPSLSRNASALERGRTGYETSAASSRSASEDPNFQSDTTTPGLPLHQLKGALDLYSQPSEGGLRSELRRINSVSALDFDVSELSLIEDATDPKETGQAEGKVDLPSTYILLYLPALAKASHSSRGRRNLYSNLGACSNEIRVSLSPYRIATPCRLYRARHRHGGDPLAQMHSTQLWAWQGLQIQYLYKGR